MKDYQVLGQIVCQKGWQGCQSLRSRAFPPKLMACRHRGKQKDFPQAKLPQEPVKLFFVFFCCCCCYDFSPNFGKKKPKTFSEPMNKNENLYQKVVLVASSCADFDVNLAVASCLTASLRRQRNTNVPRG